MRALFLFAFALFASDAAFAADCGWNLDHTFYSCGGFYSGAASGASAPTLSDLIEQNAAALPTIPTPLDIEGSYVSRAAPGGDQKFSVTALKGLRSLAFSAGSWNPGSFAGPDLENHFVGTPFENLYRTTAPGSSAARLGAALGWPEKLLPKGFSLSAGAAAGFSGSSDWAPQAGMQAIALGNLALGYTVGYLKIGASLPRVNTTNFTAGTQLFGLHLGYSYQTLKSSVHQTNESSVSAAYNAGEYALWLAQKWEKDQLGNTATWGRAGLQWRVNGRIGATYEYGMYKYSHGVSLQVNL